MANSLFPDFDGRIEIQPGNKVVNSAIPLTKDTLKGATGHDLLIVHSHQHCEASVEEFPGIQLHINVRWLCHGIVAMSCFKSSCLIRWRW